MLVSHSIEIEMKVVALGRHPVDRPKSEPIRNSKHVD